MTYRTILAAASGGTASDGVIDLACRLARRFDGHVEGFHVKIDPRDIILAAADGMGLLMPGDWIDDIETQAAANAAKTRTAFEVSAAQHGLVTAAASSELAGSAGWREETGMAPVLLARRARHFDLVVLGRSDRVVDRPHTDAVEEALLRSGRPVLLAPAQAPAVIGKNVAIGWNGEPEAVRALVSALPLLRAADAISLITVGDPSGTDSEIDPVIDYLAWHGVTAKHRNTDLVSGVGAGAQLLAEARDGGADLLVMGAYGHMPWRELLFGGATREVVGVSLLPVLLSH